MESSLCFLTPFFTSFAFQWSFSHWLSPCFAPLDQLTRTKWQGTVITSNWVLILCFCSSEGRKHRPQKQYINPLRCVFQARLTLNRLGYGCLPTHIIRYFRILELYDSILPWIWQIFQSSPNRQWLIWYGNQLVACPPNFVSWSPFLDLQVLHLVEFLQFWHEL